MCKIIRNHKYEIIQQDKGYWKESHTKPKLTLRCFQGPFSTKLYRINKGIVKDTKEAVISDRIRVKQNVTRKEKDGYFIYKFTQQILVSYCLVYYSVSGIVLRTGTNAQTLTGLLFWWGETENKILWENIQGIRIREENKETWVESICERKMGTIYVFVQMGVQWRSQEKVMLTKEERRWGVDPKESHVWGISSRGNRKTKTSWGIVWGTQEQPGVQETKTDMRGKVHRARSHTRDPDHPGLDENCRDFGFYSEWSRKLESDMVWLALEQTHRGWFVQQGREVSVIIQVWDRCWKYMEIMRTQTIEVC